MNLDQSFFCEFSDEVFGYTGTAPRADGKADGTAHIFVKERQAFIKVHIPFILSADHLFGGANGICRATILAGPAIDAKIIKPKGVSISGD